MKVRNKNSIPLSVVKRFPKYHALLQRLLQDSVQWVSSQEMAESLGLTSSTVRQDLSHLDFSGISKRGYSVEGLEKIMGKALGAHHETRIVIVGAGNLGRALALHAEFAAKGFKICGIFDSDSKLSGRRVGDMLVETMGELRDVVRERKVDIGVIAVPAGSAQEVADQLVRSNIRGILNLAHVHLLIPRSVSVVDTRIIASLQELSYAIRTNSYARAIY